MGLHRLADYDGVCDGVCGRESDASRTVEKRLEVADRSLHDCLGLATSHSVSAHDSCGTHCSITDILSPCRLFELMS